LGRETEETFFIHTNLKFIFTLLSVTYGI
jgi:hypothetical protein